MFARLHRSALPPFPRAMIFDWDNTLIDAWGAVTHAMNTVRAAFGQEPSFTNEAVKRHSARSARALFLDWYGEEWKKAHEIFYGTYEKEHINNIKPLDGSAEILAWLEKREIPAFVVSNKRGDILREEAGHLGWSGFFRAVIGSLDAPRDKPERDPVDMALGRAGMEADDPAIWFVGDTRGDVACARNAGCTPVLVNNPAEAGVLQVEMAFSSCRELLEMLYSMEDSGRAAAMPSGSGERLR